jgi:hypothetical protein
MMSPVTLAASLVPGTMPVGTQTETLKLLPAFYD